MAITLFRHGLTVGNEQRRYMGWNDSLLTEKAKAELARSSFQQKDYDLFISSDSGRCLATMAIMFPHVKPVQLTELREMDFGIFSGKTYEQLKSKQAYQEWLENQYTYRPPNGESYPMFTERIDIGWQKVIDIALGEEKDKLFIVTHGGVIRYLLTKITQGEKSFWEWEIANGAGFSLQFDREQLRSGVGCISLQGVTITGNVPG